VKKDVPRVLILDREETWMNFNISVIIGNKFGSGNETFGGVWNMQNII
jgi:hypothetical protein